MCNDRLIAYYSIKHVSNRREANGPPLLGIFGNVELGTNQQALNN